MHDYQTHLMLHGIKVLLDHLCQFVLFKTEGAGILQTPRVLSEESAYKNWFQPGEGYAGGCGPLNSCCCWSVTAIFPTVIFHATVGLRSWQGSANRLSKLAARHWYSARRRGTWPGQATPHCCCPCRSG